MGQQRRRTGGCIGLPGMIALFAFLAFALTVPVSGVLIGAIAVLAVYVIVGIALTQARRRE
jgi:uncharacterized membrane protein (DUF106 family)